MEAVQCDSHELSRIHLPKCLWMLTKDGSSYGALCQTLETRGAALPSWVWLPWIPQLLTSLYRVEGKAAKAILKTIIADYPQAIYFPLRVFYLERRDIERSRGSNPSGHHQHNAPSAVTYSEELMSALRRAHPTLWSSLEAILEEFIGRFRPSFEEELLSTVIALLQRADIHLEHQKQPDTHQPEKVDDDTVLASFNKTLGRISAKFFRIQPETVNTKDDRAKKTSEFTRRYKEDFERDFLMSSSDSSGEEQPESTVSPQKRLSLPEIIEKLKKWKKLFEMQVAATPSYLPLQQASPSLSSFSSEAPDLWAGACDSRSLELSCRDRRSDSEGVTGQASPSSSAIAATAAAKAAAEAVASAAAREGGGGHYGGGSAIVEVPGQYPPNSLNSIDLKPSPELHVKLVRFESTLQVMRRNDQLVRRIGMVGSDGKTHRFLLQFAIPYWTRTDERTAQLQYIMNKIFRREALSGRRNLFMQPNAVIPIAQRLRMIAHDASHHSLEEIYSLDCTERALNIEAPMVFFQEEVRRQVQEKVNVGVDRQALERSIKADVFKQICDNMVESNILARHVQATFGTPEILYRFRHTFTNQVAVNSLLQYAFGAVERSPTKFAFNIQNGQALAPDFRFAYNNQGEQWYFS